MYVSEIHAVGFRCFGQENALILKLHPGLNILVGPNDSGKTAVIDASRFVLWTRGDDFLRLEPADFHVKPNGERVTELLIRCKLDELTRDEEARFLEWCSNEAGKLRLYVCLRATLRKLPGGGDTVIPLYRAGKNGDGPPLEGDLREYLKTTYLKPLRDAERELRSGRRSRLSRILGALPTMAKQADSAPPGGPATLRDTMKQADLAVEDNAAVKSVQSAVNTTYLNDLSFFGDPLSATLGLGAKGSFDQLLERLELFLNPPPGQTQRLARGLGYNNLLFRIFFRVSDNGIPVVSSTYGDKGGHSVSGYHAFELDYLAHVYQLAYIPREQQQHTTFCLHFRPSGNSGLSSINVLPDFLGRDTLKISGVEIDGVPRKLDPMPADFQIPLRPDDLDRHVKVFLCQSDATHKRLTPHAIKDSHLA